MRKEWMFKLVGKEYFEIGKSRAKCCISIDAVSGFAYEYTIEVSCHGYSTFVSIYLSKRTMSTECKQP